MCGGMLAFVALAAGLALITNVAVNRAEPAQAAPQVAPKQQTETTKPVMVIYKTTNEYHQIDAKTGQGNRIAEGVFPSSLNSVGRTYVAIGKNGDLYGLSLTSRRDSNNDTDYYWRMGHLPPNATTPVVIGDDAYICEECSGSNFTIRGATFLGDIFYVNVANSIYPYDISTGLRGDRFCSSNSSYLGLTGVGNILYAYNNSERALYTIGAPPTAGGSCVFTRINAGTDNALYGGTYNNMYSMVTDGTSLYGIAQESESPNDYHLVTINRTTGVATRLGSSTYAEDLRLTSTTAFMAHDHYFINTSGMTACADSDAENHGIFDGTSSDIQGSFLTVSCLADTDENSATEDAFLGDDDKSPARIFTFQMKSGREADITINPTKAIPFTWLGEYRFRLRTGGIDGAVLAASVGGGRGSFSTFRVSLGGSTEYTLEVMRAGVGGGPEFSINLAYPYIPPNTPTPIPTQTPVPTPTPRVQTNEDVRLFPNPQNENYQQGKSYSFQLEGADQHFPVRLLLGNVGAFSVSKTQQANCTSPANEITELRRGDFVNLHVCDVSGSPNSLVRVLRTSDDTEMALYSIHARGETAVEVARVPATAGASDDVSERDEIGLTIFISAICSAAGMSCDAGVLKNTLALAVSGLLAIVPTLAAGGRVSTPGIALGLVMFAFGLAGSYLLVGLPLWMLALLIVALVVAAGMGIMMRVARVNL